MLAHRVSVSFAIALTRDIPTIYGSIQEGFFEELPGALHACKIVISGHSVAQKLDLSDQVDDLARDQPGPIHHGPNSGLGGK